jgi:predicted nucleotidyltransferase
MGEFYEREVMRKTKISKGSANKVLRLLANLALLTRNEKGRMVFYALNAHDPLVRQFKVLFNVYELRELVESLNQHSQRAVLFGSCSQGTDSRESDIDLFVATSERAQVGKIIAEFNEKGERKISAIVVTATELAALKRSDRALYDNIERGIVLWQAD